MIEVNHITICYNRTLLEDAKISLPQGKMTCLIGKSGIGKSSLLYVLGLISKINYKTEYNFNGYPINLRDDEEKSLFRRQHIGYVFQENNILEYMTIEENFRWLAQLSGKSIDDTAMHTYLRLVRLSNLSIKKYPKNISGGERQRLNIALALSKKPDLLLLDEPTSALDKENRQQLIYILKDILNYGKMTILAVSHDEQLKNESDCVYEINDKKIKLISGKIQNNNNNKIKIEKKQKLNKPLLTYALTQLKRNIKFYLIGFFFSGMVLGSCVFFQGFNKDYQIMIDKTFGDSRLTEIRAANVNWSKETYHQIENDSRVTKIYPYEQYIVHSIQIDNELIEKEMVVEFYNEQMLTGNGIYISKSIQHLTNSNSKLNIQMNGIDYEWMISGEIPKDYASLYQSNKNVILIPFNESDRVLNDYLIYVNDLKNVDAVMKYIRNLNPNAQLQNQSSSIELIQETVHSISRIGVVYTGIILVVIVLMLYAIYNRIISNRKLEILLLKANGLTKKNIRFVFNTEIIFHLTFMTIFSLIGYFICSIVFYQYYHMNMQPDILVNSLKCFLLSSGSVLMISGINLYRLNKNESSELLRR